jgi:plastocyanin
MSGRRGLAGFAVPALLGAMIAVPVVAGGAPAATAATAAAPARTAAAAPPVVIGVDNAPPPDQNWEYTHYFPESNVNVPQGGLVLFQWNQGSPNGLHTVTFVPNGSTDTQVRQQFPLVTQDTDNGETDTVIPPQTNNPTDLTCGTSPAAPPCTFDGTKVVSSGLIPASTGAAFPVQIAPNAAPGTYHYICLVHPGMEGTLTVVPAGQPASAPAALAAQAATEYNQLTAGAFAAQAANSVPTYTQNVDGTRTWNVHVGLTVDDVDLLEFLPQSLPIRKGDSVKFDGSGTTQEAHTVTTLGGANAGLGFFGPNECEAASGPDTPAKPENGPPELGCADPSTLEQVVNLGVQGEPTNITSGATAASAFVGGNPAANALGGATSHTYAFPSNGSFIMICTIHAGMGFVASTPGYRVAQSTGAVSSFGAADPFGSKTSGLAGTVVASPPTFDNQGYWLVTSTGHTYNFGDAGAVGNISGPYNGSPIVGAVAGGGPDGLWLVARDGRVYPLGHAQFMGDLGGTTLAAPIVGMSSDSGGSGYDLVGADGGVFTFGTPAGIQPSRFYGSLGAIHLNAPIVGMADLIGGGGYYLVAKDGGVFAFGAAAFEGSLGNVHLVAPIVGITAISPQLGAPGYRLVAGDGGVFNFGSAGFLGSAAPVQPPDTGVAIN